MTTRKHYVLYVETDDDFSIKYQGEIYNGEFWMDFQSVDQLDQIEVCAPYGSPHTEHTKSSEFFEGLEIIKANPNEPYDSTGGNRGIAWWLEEYTVDRPESPTILSEEQQDTIRNAWLDMVASLSNYHNYRIGGDAYNRGACEIANAMADSVADLEKNFSFLSCGDHLQSCDDDGFCNSCGEQE